MAMIALPYGTSNLMPPACQAGARLHLSDGTSPQKPEVPRSPSECRRESRALQWRGVWDSNPWPGRVQTSSGGYACRVDSSSHAIASLPRVVRNFSPHESADAGELGAGSRPTERAGGPADHLGEQVFRTWWSASRRSDALRF